MAPACPYSVNLGIELRSAGHRSLSCSTDFNQQAAMIARSSFLDSVESTHSYRLVEPAGREGVVKLAVHLSWLLLTDSLRVRLISH